MKAVFTLSLLATSFAGCAASADAHNGLVRRAAGHALPAKRFEKRTIRLGARAEIPDVGYLSVSANASSATSSDPSTSTMVISNSSEAVWVNGTALWYNSTGLGGSCKVDYNSTDLLVSLPASFYPDKAVVSPLCGEQVLIKDLASGNNVSAIVSDTSSNEYLVLSNSAFQVLSDLAVGMLDVQYYFYNSSINATLPATSSSAAPLVPSSTAVARVASTQAPTTTEAPQTTTTPAYDYASASSASKASADAAWASSSSAQAAASKSSADAAWAASSSSSSAAGEL
ncbi:hypothetical protein BCR35DRAFT_43708 [Leucosporidium creatinivorum]|uniref:Uncharacterized protein n=1 Tax=Leucosporidium creatinivorum TaxID=106004 RepID=A0A1Y2FRK6_9BASI|nr:hypothetical protein BCR35DRAFT_43708 [Leucosporidium creatinivorum]